MRPFLGKIADALAAVGLAGPMFRLFERLQALGAGGPAEDAGLPLPPPYMRVLTAGSPDAAVFVQTGRSAADAFMALAARHGRPFAPERAALDFGCGCGRTARHLVREAALSGCDLNRKLAGWCAMSLPGSFQPNAALPPTPYPDATFDLVYSVSVFTHLHQPNAKAWLDELARVTRSGGLAFLTFFDEHIPQAAAFLPQLMDRGFVVRHEGPEGSNLLCGYFSTEAFAAAAAPGWRMLEAVASPTSGLGQAVAVFERT